MAAVSTNVVISEHDDLTSRLLDAAAEVFIKRGIDKAGVAAVARLAGVTTGAIYSRWPGKHEMMIDALDRVMSREFHDALLSHPDPGAPDVLASLGQDLVTSRNRSADCLLAEALTLARRDADFGLMLRRMFAEQEGRLAEIIDEGKANGLIDVSLETESIVALCHAISVGFVMFGAIDRPMPSADGWDRVIKRMVAAALPANQPSHNTQTTGAD